MDDTGKMIYLVGGLEHDFYFPRNIGNFIIPIDFHIFQRGRYTTNQYSYLQIFIGDFLIEIPISVVYFQPWMPEPDCHDGHRLWIHLVFLGGSPSGKHTQNHGKSACLMGKHTVSTAIFNSYFDARG